MKLWDFLKDRMPAYLISLAAEVILILFLRAFRVNVQVMILCGTLFFCAVLLQELWEFSRKKKFYGRLAASLEELDQKYLLLEMVQEPDFYEGKIIYEALRAADKSMCENVAEYRKQSREFREYIEMWVHEVKIPVSGLLLMCHNNPESGRKFSGQLKRIDDYIENVLYYARSENAEKDFIIKEVLLKRVFADVAVKNREVLQQMDVEIKTTGLDVPVLTDGKWLEFIIGQLMDNSLKYVSAQRKPEFCVSAEDFPDKVAFYFRDNGIGMPKSDLPYIFEKSFTGSNGRKGAKSTGMGLYIVKSLCTRLGHQVTAESVEGEFTTIRIIFAKNDFYRVKSNTPQQAAGH